MKRYRRILSGREREAILCNGLISPSHSRDWEPLYQPHTVVFLFDLDFVDLKQDSQFPQLHYENHGETWILEFNGDIQTEHDISQTGWSGAVVFRGFIPLSQISEVVWTKYEPLA